MKATKKILSLLLVLAVIAAFGATAFAETVTYTGTGATTDGKIVISNAAKGETYRIIKLFDATVSADGSAIAYTGDIPSALNAFFQKDSAGNITAKPAAKNGDSMSDELKTALQEYSAAVLMEKTCESSPLTFDKVPYGYYIVQTTQGDALVTVDSTTRTANVVDKNTTPPVNNLSKSASETDVFVGDTVTYTVSFDTANYTSDNKLIVKYILEDDFANGALTDVTVTSLKIGGATVSPAPQFSNGKIELTWANGDPKASLYANGAKIELVYTAKVAASAAIDGQGNKNTVTANYEDEDGNGGTPSQQTSEETIYTYAVALKKVNEKGEALSGVVFELPFYVNSTAGSDNAYVYAGDTAGTGLVNELTTPADGLIIIKGVKSGDYSFTEKQAPAGYNKLTAPVTVTATKTGNTSTSTTVYLDENGNIVNTASSTTTEVTVTIADLSASAAVVVNRSGTELPATGGVGTTIFYVLGSALLLGAAVLMITRKRMSSEG